MYILLVPWGHQPRIRHGQWCKCAIPVRFYSWYGIPERHRRNPAPPPTLQCSCVSWVLPSGVYKAEVSGAAGGGQTLPPLQVTLDGCGSWRGDGENTGAQGCGQGGVTCPPTLCPSHECSIPGRIDFYLHHWALYTPTRKRWSLHQVGTVWKATGECVIDQWDSYNWYNK